MAKTVTINGQNYTLSQQGDNPAWGEQLSSLLQALIDVSNNISNTGDISLTSFTVANNVSSATDVTSLQFDVGVVRAATISYSVYRSTTLSELAECGQIYVVYKSTAATWELVQTNAGSGGITFTITSGGQVQYTSTNMSGSSYSGLMKFSARAFTQT